MIFDFYADSGRTLHADLCIFASYSINRNNTLGINVYADRDFREGNDEKSIIQSLVLMCEDALCLGNGTENIFYFNPDRYESLEDGTGSLSDGMYIAVEFSKENSEEFRIITNAKNPDELLGACACLTVKYNKNESGKWKKQLSIFISEMQNRSKNKLYSDTEKETETTWDDDDQTGFIMELFSEGICCLVCDSKKEYALMKEVFKFRGFNLDKTVWEDGWQDVCRFVYIDYDKTYQTGTPTISASSRLPDGFDGAVSFHKIIEKAELEENEVDDEA